MNVEWRSTLRDAKFGYGGLLLAPSKHKIIQKGNVLWVNTVDVVFFNYLQMHTSNSSLKRLL